jgi:hypothetical protein
MDYRYQPYPPHMPYPYPYPPVSEPTPITQSTTTISISSSAEPEVITPAKSDIGRSQEEASKDNEEDNRSLAQSADGDHSPDPSRSKEANQFPDGGVFPDQEQDIKRVEQTFSLKFEKLLGEGADSRVRLFRSDAGLTFYDCTCGGRKPSRCLSKIQDHSKNHDLKFRVCKYCDKKFSSYRSLNAHKRAHKHLIVAEREAKRIKEVGYGSYPMGSYYHPYAGPPSYYYPPPPTVGAYPSHPGPDPCQMYPPPPTAVFPPPPSHPPQ